MLAKTVARFQAAGYPILMLLVRHLFSCLSIAVVIAISANGVAMAANGIGHQTHCLDEGADTFSNTTLDEAHDHDHDHAGPATPHTVPKHDHETCMIHACPALSAEAFALRQSSDVVLMTVRWSKKTLQALELSDGLKRPPKT